MYELRFCRHLFLASLALIFTLTFSLDSRTALAQTPDEQPDTANQQLFLPLAINGGDNAPADETEVEAARRPKPPGVKLLIDTDPGVDDAVALAYIFNAEQRPNVLGIVSVAGNASIYNTTSNALTILEKLKREDVPLVMGAAAPRGRTLSKAGYFIHGPDGLWFLGWQNPHDLSKVRTDATAFYCSTVASNPGTVLLALGPLTNLANAVQQCPDTMRSLARLVVLGGAKYGGNQTPVAEFNFWQDPEAAAIVLAAGLPITLVPLDAFAQPTLTQQDLDKLFRRANPTIQFLAPAIQQYAGVQIDALGSATFPDPVAAAAALDGSVGVRQSGLVRMVLDSVLARGQSVIALTLSERITVIADEDEMDALAERAFANPPDPSFDLAQELGAILMRAPDNAQVTLSVDSDLLRKTVLPSLTAK